MGLTAIKSPGPDGLHTSVLKEVALEIMDPLVIILQNSLKTGTFPVDWKSAIATPLFKKRWRQNVGNYRPVGLTSVVGKC